MGQSNNLGHFTLIESIDINSLSEELKTEITCIPSTATLYEILDGKINSKIYTTQESNAIFCTTESAFNFGYAIGRMNQYDVNTLSSITLEIAKNCLKNDDDMFYFYCTNNKTKQLLVDSQKYKIVTRMSYNYDYEKDPKKVLEFNDSYYIGNTKYSISEAQDEELISKLTDGFYSPKTKYGSIEKFKTNNNKIFYSHETSNPLNQVCTIFDWSKSKTQNGQNVSEIGIRTFPDFQNQGHGTNITQYYLKHCYNNDITPTWSCDTLNTKSQKCAESLGFTKTIEFDMFLPHSMEQRHIQHYS